MTAIVETAPAKINLALHVRRRRDDGYHELETLFAFCRDGDVVTVERADRASLTLTGPFADVLAGESQDDNLVMRAARGFGARFGVDDAHAITLDKHLPVASGIGGGSADAAAALRLLARLNDLPLSHPALLAAAGRIGADVPVCLEARARVMRGIGERLGPALRLPRLFALLVNPGVAVETAPVFRALGLQAGQRYADAVEPFNAEAFPQAKSPALIATLAATGNDLEAPARAVAPVVGEVLSVLSGLPGCRLARMSGSGATCFALFDDCHASAAGGKILVRSQPDWWVKPTVLR